MFVSQSTFFTCKISYSYITRKVKVFVFHYFPTKSCFFTSTFNFCHIFSISYFLKYIRNTWVYVLRIPTNLFSKEPYAAICAPYYYILVNNWLRSIMKSHYLILHCMVPNCHRKFVLKNASKESFLLDV